MVELILAASATALATGVGAIPVFLLGEDAARLRPALLGLAAGVMTVASVAGLLLPALDDGSAGEVVGGLAAGIVFLLTARAWLGRHPGRTGARPGAPLRMSVLVFAVLFVHSLPEGFAIGTAYASDTSGLSLFVIVAIAIQNIPEGTSVAIPMAAAGFGPSQQFWAAVGTSAPQPIGAVIAYLLVEQISGLLPVSFGFAAGAMLALVAIELVPESLTADPRLAVAGATIGGAAMLALSWVLGV
jgi:zinc transporter, ZIP family